MQWFFEGGCTPELWQPDLTVPLPVMLVVIAHETRVNQYERRLFLSRRYRVAARSTRMYLPLKLPVALDADRALLVYADPGHDTLTALSTRADTPSCLRESATAPSRSSQSTARTRSSIRSRPSLSTGR